MEPVNQFSVVVVTRNLFFLSKLQALSRHLGCSLITAQNSQQLKQMLLGKCPRMLVIDLASLGDELDERLKTLLDLCPNMDTLAFGPHAQPSLLRLARSMGIRQVVPNSKLENTFVVAVKRIREDQGTSSS